MIKNILESWIKDSLKELLPQSQVILEHPTDITRGDFSLITAMAESKKMNIKPIDLAQNIAQILVKNKIKEVERVESVLPGFVNIYLSKEFLTSSVSAIINKEIKFSEVFSGKKVLIEYTDPNPFKEFHIGHLMSNSVGESLSRLIEVSGAKVVRANYQGDVGLQVAKTIYYAIKNKNFPGESEPLDIKTSYLGKAYAEGSKMFEENEEFKKEIQEINKKIYLKSDPEINSLYDKGRKWSLEHFEQIYKKVDTKFDHYFFESEMTEKALSIVNEFLEKGVFEKSDGAIVFKGEKYGLHTRVFVNSQGLPTYEAKELALNLKKFETEKDLDLSVIITANEQDGYFKVILKVLSLVYPEIAKKTIHISHGLLKFASGKMSSRLGNVITGESLIVALERLSLEEMKDREIEDKDKEKIAEDVAIGAVKYSILKSSVGSDIVYDFEKSISFEGDSGPYLQYSAVRAKSVIDKSSKEGIVSSTSMTGDEKLFDIERLLYRFPEIIERSVLDYSSHHLASYLISLSVSFNSFYANEKIVDKNDENSGYKIAVTKAFLDTVTKGLNLLGIKVPYKM